mgnify:CR=1 FL=1
MSDPLSPGSGADAPTSLDSAVREVQVFRRGAVVTRCARLPAGTIGPVALSGLPLCLLDESLRAAVEPDDQALAARAPRPGDVRAELLVPPLGELLAPPAPEELRAQERRIGELQARMGELQVEVEAYDRLRLSLPAWKGDEAPRAVSAGPWLEALEWQRRAFEARAAERAVLGHELRAAQEELERLHRREAEARARRDARADAVSKRVVLTLRGEPLPGPATLRVEYRVPGAWWVPSYVLRLARDGRSARLSLRAHVVQYTGEAWERVRLFASTADVLRETALPELTSLRIGRRQVPPLRRAWREPPGRDATLEEGLEKAHALLRQAAAAPAAPDRFQRDEDLLEGPEIESGAFELFDEDEGGADPFGAPVEGALGGSASFAASIAPPPPPANRPMPPGAPAPARKAMFDSDQPVTRAERTRSAGAEMAKRAKGGARGGGGGAARPAPECAPEPPPPPALDPERDLLRYGALALTAWEAGPGGGAGQLRRLGERDRMRGLEPHEQRAVQLRLAQAREAAARVERVALPAHTVRVERSSGHYDHRYDAEGPVDVPSDGALHDVPLLSQEAPVRSRLVVVPRESEEAVRVATLTNPLEAPLLSGPAEVYLGDEFLVTTPLRTVPTGGELELGLGVEPGLKVARNTFYEEVSTGLLGGGLSLKHRIEISVASRLSAPVEVEVRELVPIKADDDQAVGIVEEGVAPAWEKLPRQEDGSEPKGGRRWRLSLAPGQEQKLTGGFRLDIDAKQELSGGNRRTS